MFARHKWSLPLGILILLVFVSLACGGADDLNRPDIARTPAQVSTRVGQAQPTVEAAAQTAEAAAGKAKPTVEAAAQTAEAAAGQAKPTVEAVAQTAQAVATQSQPTVQAALTKSAAVVGTVQAIDPGAAENIITTYAQDVLGISVKVVKAGGLTADVDRQINLSSGGDEAQTAVAKMAVRTCGAVLQGGAASVSYGSGTVSGDLTVDIKSSSLGAFSFDKALAPADEAGALQLALETFPGLKDRAFEPQTAQKGYAWLARSEQAPGFDVKTMQATLVAETVLMGVMPAGARRSAVYAVVGMGDFAADVKP